MNQKEQVLHNWLPYKLFFQEGECACHWLYMGAVNPDEPFFEHSLLHMKALPENVKPFRQTSLLDMLPAWSKNLKTATPAAIVFHLSRCGSTLVTQSLCLDPEHIVLSEVPFFDEILRIPYKGHTIADEQLEQWLMAAVDFHAQKRNGTEKRLFIKTDCWHIFFYEKLRKLFPAVPFIFLYRKPDEVLQSQQKRRGMQAVPGLIEPELMGMVKDELDYTQMDDYFSRVMEKILARFYQLVQTDDQVILLNYNQGIEAIMEEIATASGMQMSDEMKEKIKERSRFHAKYPDQVFAEERKPVEISGPLANAMEWYQLLEEKRQISL
ncbi:MAG: hypothetical protein NTW29_05920 [Bacteroidetes bacterium]|nr:hypothetical protein [Bacteroidota bacterium]